MTTNWNCEASVVTKAPRPLAWAFWTNMDNHARMESVTIELDGPFLTGTMGRTITGDFQQEWELRDVVRERRFAIYGTTDDGRGALSFAWTFENEGKGTRITYRISATGPDVESQADAFRGLEERAPLGIQAVGAELDRLFMNGAFES